MEKNQYQDGKSNSSNVSSLGSSAPTSMNNQFSSASSKADDLIDTGKDIYNKLGTTSKIYYKNTTEFVRKYPVASVLGATALGYIAAMAMPKKH